MSSNTHGHLEDTHGSGDTPYSLRGRRKRKISESDSESEADEDRSNVSHGASENDAQEEYLENISQSIDYDDSGVRNSYKYDIFDNQNGSLSAEEVKMTSFYKGHYNLIGDVQGTFILDCGRPDLENCQNLANLTKEITDCLPSYQVKAIIIRAPKLECYNLLPHLIFQNDSNMMQVNCKIVVEAMIISGDPAEFGKHDLFVKLLFCMLSSFPELKVFFTVLKTEATPFLRKKTLGQVQAQLKNWSCETIINDPKSNLVEEYYYSFGSRSYIMRGNPNYKPPWFDYLCHNDVNIRLPVVNASCKRVLKNFFLCHNHIFNDYYLIVFVFMRSQNILFLGNMPPSMQKTCLTVLQEPLNYINETSTRRSSLLNGDPKRRSLNDIIIITHNSTYKDMHESLTPSVIVLQSVYRASKNESTTLEFFKSLISIFEGDKPHQVEVYDPQCEMQVRKIVDERKMIFTLHSPISFIFHDTEGKIYQ